MSWRKRKHQTKIKLTKTKKANKNQNFNLDIFKRCLTKDRHITDKGSNFDYYYLDSNMLLNRSVAIGKNGENNIFVKFEKESEYKVVGCFDENGEITMCSKNLEEREWFFLMILVTSLQNRTGIFPDSERIVLKAKKKMLEGDIKYHEEELKRKKELLKINARELKKI